MKPDTFDQWLKEHQAELIVATDADMVQFLQEAYELGFEAGYAVAEPDFVENCR